MSQQPPPQPQPQPTNNPLRSFDPFALHPFTSGSPPAPGSPAHHPPAALAYATGIPVTAYPGHIVAASTSPSRSPPNPSSSSSQPQPIQSPQPRHPPQVGTTTTTMMTRGFSIGSGASASSESSSSGSSSRSSNGGGGGTYAFPPSASPAAPHPIFEAFRKESLTPDLDDLPLAPKRRTNAWDTRELEESMRGSNK